MGEEVLSLSIVELSKLIREKKISPIELMEHTLKRIDETNPVLNSFVTIDYENALKKAKFAEKNINDSKKNILHGIPIGIKDNINTEGLTTTYGSPIYKSFVPEKDAFVIKLINNSGGIIVGKHVTHQFAYGPTGDRSLQGASKNPHNIKKMTGGSSGGSAASVAAHLNYAALGTDTGGSIRIPAAFCGVVGMKPTFGSISNRGVYPLVWSMDHVGPITRTIYDNAIMLNLTSQYDSEDYTSINRKQEDFTRLIGLNIKNMTVGIPTNFFYDDLNKEIEKSVHHTIDLLQNSGVNLKYLEIEKMDQYLESQRIIMRSEAYLNHENNLKNYPDSWDDEVKERLLTGEGVNVKEYAKALQNKFYFSQEMNKHFEYVDIILTPTTPILPLRINERYIEGEIKKEHIRNWITKFTAPFNLIGYPSLSMPSGYSNDGLPIGIQLIGNKFNEAILYQFGYVIEQALSIQSTKKHY